MNIFTLFTLFHGALNFALLHNVLEDKWEIAFQEVVLEVPM